jgi:hypothetical protein
MNPGLIIVGAVALLALAALVFGVFLLVRSLRARGTRRTIVALIGRKESILAAHRALWGVVERLAGADDRELYAFSTDPDSEERQSFVEIASQMRITEDELKNTEVARSLESVVMSMEDAARLIFEAARTVDGAGESDPLVAAGEIDFAAIAEAIACMESILHEAAERNHVDDRSVYGGGLYI